MRSLQGGVSADSLDAAGGDERAYVKQSAQAPASVEHEVEGRRQQHLWVEHRIEVWLLGTAGSPVDEEQRRKGCRRADTGHGYQPLTRVCQYCLGLFDARAGTVRLRGLRLAAAHARDGGARMRQDLVVADLQSEHVVGEECGTQPTELHGD